MAFFLSVAITIAQHCYKNAYDGVLLRLDESAAFTTKYLSHVRRRSRMMTTFAILTAILLFYEETYNWGQTLDSLLNVIFAWLVTIMGLLVTFKMLLVVYAIRMILREINESIDLFLTRGVKMSMKLEFLVDVHASLCEIVGETNRIFQPVLMCSHMMNFINLLTESYYVTLIAANLEKSFVENSGSILLGTSIWFLFSAMSFIMSCTECDKTVEEVYCRLVWLT